MRFICSVNEKVVGALHPSTGKVEAGGDFSVFNSAWIQKEITVDEIATAVKNKQGLCAWHLVNGKREKDNTLPIHAGLIIIDIDNQADGKDKDGNKIQKQELTWQQAEQLEICQNYLSLAYNSPSNTDSWPRFRLVFGLEKPIIDPDFYQWFTRQIAASIPGSDIRATSAVNLFYGCKDEHGFLYRNDKFIPISKIEEAQKAFAVLPKETQDSGGSALEALENCEVDPKGVDMIPLFSKKVQNTLDGIGIEDRSMWCTTAVKEIIGWVNWFRKNKITSNKSGLTIAHDAFYAIYEYPAGEGKNDKFNRIVESIRDVDSIEPAIVMASEHDDVAAWLRLKAVNSSAFEGYASEEVKQAIKDSRPAPRNSILHLAEFGIDEEQPKGKKQTPTPTLDTNMSTPDTPAQLVDINNRAKKKQTFGENDCAKLIAEHNEEDLLFCSTQDSFFAFDKDKGVWLRRDDVHIRQDIQKVLKSFVAAGLLPGFKSSTVNSILTLLEGELLRSCSKGTESIFTTGRGHIPFNNGALCTKTLEFVDGKNETKELYFRDRHPYDWDDKAKCPKFKQWLTDCLRPGQEILIQAFCRALLTGYTAGERFLHLVGPGRTGKSTMQQLMMALAGYNSTQSTTLEQIENNKFETFNLMGKRLVLLADESNYNKRMDTLKKLTSASDTIRAEKKYGSASIQFKPECLVCIASNEHITSGDSTSGLERRRLTIVMDKVVDSGKVRELLSVFDDRVEGEFVPELPGIVSWALSMPEKVMRSVLANPVNHAPSLAQTDIEALIFNNQFVGWLQECTLYAPNTQTLLGRGAGKPTLEETEKGLFVRNAYKELYASYADYCKQCGYKPCAKPRFVERTLETLTNILKLKGCKKSLLHGMPAIKGLRLKAYELTSDGASLGSTRLPNPVEFAQNPDFAAWKHAFEKHDAA